MHNYKVTFTNPDNGKTKSIIVKHMGLVPAIEEAIRKFMCFDYLVTKAEQIK